MRLARHTGGPWRYDEDWNAIWGGECDVAIVAPGGCQFVSDALIMAASPDLLDALSGFVNAVEDDVIIVGPSKRVNLIELLEAASAAIAKARGQGA